MTDPLLATTVDEMVAERIKEILGDIPDEDLAKTLLERLPDDVLIAEAARRLSIKPFTGPDFSVFDTDEDRWDKKEDGLWYCDGCGDDGEYTQWTWDRLFDRYEQLKDADENIVRKDGTLA